MAETHPARAHFVDMPPDMPWAHVGSAGNNTVILGLDEGDVTSVQVLVTKEQAAAFARAITQAVAAIS
jgi:hypothetical protein